MLVEDSCVNSDISGMVGLLLSVDKTDVLDETAVMAGPSMLVEDSCVNSDNSGMMGLLLSVEQDGCVR